jgi:hypothetical protein
MIALGWIDTLKHAFQAVLDGAGTLINGLIKLIFEPILTAVAKAVGVVMSTIGTFWISLPTPAVGSVDAQGNPTGTPASGTVSWVWDHTSFLSISIATIALIVGCMRMAWTQRGESARDLLKGLMTLAVASAFVIAVAQVLIGWSDTFSNCLVTSSLMHGSDGWVCPGDPIPPGQDVDFGKAMLLLLGFGGVATAGSPLGIGLLICLGLLCIIAGVIQIVLMVVRSAMLILLLGVLPIAAAATNTEMGKEWFKKILSWIFAFILYKPVAAIVYAAAIRLTSNNGDLSFDPTQVGGEVMNVVTGLTMLVLALFALPALMRFIVPMVAATAGSAGAGMMAARMIGMDKLGDMANKGAQQGSDSGGGGEEDGPSGAQNVGNARQQAPSSGPSGGESAGGESAAAAGGEGGAAGAAGGASGGAAGGAAGGAGGGAAAAGGGAAAAAGPAAVAVVAVKAGVDATKAFGEMAADTMGEGKQTGGGGSGGRGGGGGPSGSAPGGDPNRQGGQQGFDDNSSGGNQPPPPAPDGPSGSG